MEIGYPSVIYYITSRSERMSNHSGFGNCNDPITATSIYTTTGMELDQTINCLHSSIPRLDLQINVGKEPALMGLLHVYKTYFPDLILTPLEMSSQTIFKCPDQNTADAIVVLQDRWNHLADQSHASLLNGSKDPIVRNGVCIH
jgi:hypothetical protein